MSQGESSRRAQQSREPSRILLIRLREIGDVVFTTPAIRGVRERYPRAHITYLVEPGPAPVVAHNPHLTAVLVAPRERGARGLLQDLRLIRRLRSERFDLVIDFHGGPRASLLAWLSGAPTRVGYDVVGRSWMYTVRAARARVLRSRHSVENQWDLLSALGIEGPHPAMHRVEMTLDPAVASRVRGRLHQAGVGAADRLIVIHVSAGNPFRRWPLASFAAVAGALVRRDPRRRILITSGPSEVGAALRTIEEARAQLSASDGSRIVACGEFTLAELRALADGAALYIGGDSGPMHIASTGTVPIVALYGPTLPARSEPWRPGSVAVAVEVPGLPCRPCDQRTCEPGDFRCLTRIEPAQVIEAAERALAAGDKMS